MNFCKIINLPKEHKNIFFAVSKNKSLHQGDMIFLKFLCKKLNKILNNNEKTNPIYLSLNKFGIEENEEYGILLNWRKKIFLSPEIQIFLKLKSFYNNIDPFQQIRYSSNIFVNKEIASSRLRIFGKISEIENAEKILIENKFNLIYIGKEKIMSSTYKESISGFKNCYIAFDKYKPDAILTFDNFWMHYCLSKEINCFIVQRLKFSRINFKNHVLNLNKVCGDKIYYV